MSKRMRAGFTLIEILVVLAIVLLVTVIAVPRIYSALNGRQVTDGARVFTGALAGVRDAAIKSNEPRGLRLMPDPLLTIPAPGLNNSGTTQLIYNRMLPIEPAGDYNEGRINIGPRIAVGAKAMPGFPPAYPRDVTGSVYPFYPMGGTAAQVLMVEESLIGGGFTFIPNTGNGGVPNAPTNWWWTIRVGDKIRLHSTGRAYTIVGPLTISPWGSPRDGTLGNWELFVNVGAPGTQSPLVRSYYKTTNATTPAFQFVTTGTPEFLFVVNGEDDPIADGFVDSGWNGYNDDADSMIDELDEWETEQWASSLGDITSDIGDGSANGSPTMDWLTKNWTSSVQDIGYTIQRQPVPTAGAREIALPRGVVIDATTWNTTRERSRIPVLQGSCYCDIMLNPNGQLIPTTIYSTPASAGENPFLHFWLTDSSDVYPRGSVWGTGANGPNSNPSGAGLYELPMPTDAMGGPVTAIVEGPGYYPPSNAPVSPVPVLKGDRRLVTLFPRNGMVVTNQIESIRPTNLNMPGEGFYVLDVGYPFKKAQLGQREAR
jgi:prepilin-type N-terminal cleavage/methylation domain-containing protein